MKKGIPPITFKITVPSYGQIVYYSISNNAYDVIRSIKIKHNTSKNLTQKECSELDGVVIEIENTEPLYAIVLRRKRRIDLDTLFHENYHLTRTIIDRLHFKNKKDREEEEANINGYLDSMLLKKVMDLGEKINYSKTKKIKIIVIKNINSWKSVV